MEVGAFEKAGVTVNDYTETLDRFSEIHEWAKVRMGAEKLEEITKKTNLKGFELRPYSPTLWDATDKVVISCIPGESDDSAIWAQISANERLATPAATAETTPQCLGTAPPKPRMIHTHPPKVNVSKSTEQSQLF